MKPLSFPLSARFFVSVVFCVLIFAASARTAAAQTMYVTDFAGVNLNGKSFFIPASQEYQF